MLLQNTLDLSTFEIVRFRIWNQTSHPDDKGVGTKYFNTNSGHEGYNRENIYTATGWRMSAYMDDIDRINEKLDLIFGEEIDTDTIIDSWKEVQDFLAGIEDTKNLMDLLNSKLDKKGGIMDENASITWGAEGGSFIRGNGAGGLFISSSVLQYRTLNGNNFYDIIHTGNALDQLKGTFLPLTGGTINSANQIPLTIKSSNTTYSTIRLQAGNNYVTFGAKHRGDTLDLFVTETNKWDKEFFLLHSGNIGDYALKTDGSNTMAKGTYIDWVGNNRDGEDYDSYGYGLRILTFDTASSNYRGGIHVGTRYGFQLTRQATNDKNYFTVRFNDPSNNNAWSDWKTIAFTDSDITGNAATATKLKDKVSLWGNEFDGTQSLNNKITIANRYSIAWVSNDGAANIEALVLNDGNNFLIGQGVARAGGDTLIYGNNIKFCYGTAGSSAQTAMLINASGNVTIGTGGYASETYAFYVQKALPSYFSNRVLIGVAEDDGESALQVNNKMSIGASKTSFGLRFDRASFTAWIPDDYQYSHNMPFQLKKGDAVLGGFGHYIANGEYIAYIGNNFGSPWFSINSNESNFKVPVNFGAGALIPTGQTLTIGSVTFRETAAGEVEVDGNLHTTGTLASGGKGEAGENTTGNAMVYQYDLASGESVYTVDNVKGSTNVIVQIFEWNSNTSSWDMILTDVSVKADAITVTFGRTTTVNHMVTVC